MPFSGQVDLLHLLNGMQDCTLIILVRELQMPSDGTVINAVVFSLMKYCKCFLEGKDDVLFKT